MRHRLPVFLAAALLCAAAANAKAQNGSSGDSAQAPSQTPGTTSGAAPANTSAQPASKKVWTNEDVGGLRGNDPISTSTVGVTDPKAGAKPGTSARNKNTKPYKAQIAKLEAQIPPIDSQIADLQAAIDGKPTGDGQSSQRPRGVKADDWTAEMEHLKAKRDGILDQIAALKDEARHQGVAPNTLP